MPITKPPLLPNTRPQFSRDLSLKQFSAYYWYKDELAAALRNAEKRGDLEKTVADLVAVYEKNRNYEDRPDSRKYF